MYGKRFVEEEHCFINSQPYPPFSCNIQALRVTYKPDMGWVFAYQHIVINVYVHNTGHYNKDFLSLSLSLSLIS